MFDFCEFYRQISETYGENAMSEGVLLGRRRERGTTINGIAYYEILNLRSVVQNKRCEPQTVLVHDNMRQPIARLTKTLLDSFCWEQFYHPPYSPDLTPSVFHLFSHLKKCLADQHLPSDYEI
ncbi:mariner Mos1 transposase [Caerostris darwini]|uniref:Mariner Mos1 transposase n=1 Tax=Caerostris darwini TaxID=1538125 RepID=A0AAV4ME78_9ARAC|nr:mariner Mos1 transposase [Caerostris darwini]